MKYTKYEMGSYNLHVIKTDKFKTVNMRIMFKRKTNKDDINYRNFLSQILLEATKNYPTKREIEIKCEDLYGLACRSDAFVSGNYSVITFDSTFLNEKYTEEGMFKQIFEFLFDIILNPYIIDNKFDKNSFKNIKNDLINNIESVKDIPNYYCVNRLFELIGKTTPIALKSQGYLETIDEVTEENLYKYYQTMIKSDNIDIFIIGNIDDSYIKKIVKQTIPINTLKKPTGSHYIEHDKIRSRAQIIKESSTYEQSKLLLGYKLDHLTDFEKQYVMTFYSYILGGGSDSKLFKTVREQNSLCYSISASHNVIANLLIIKVGIDACNYKKTLALIKKEVKNMEKGIFEEKSIEQVKLLLKNSYKEIEDSPVSILSMHLLHEYLQKDLLEKRYQEIEKVDKQMIINVSKKIHLDTIYLLEGVKNEEK
ncbi:MAG: pitrilysin family protein [Bacilli bacterium]